MFLNLHDRTDCGSVSRVRIQNQDLFHTISQFINPLPCDVPFVSPFKDHRNTSRATDRSLEGPSVFIEVNLFLYVVITTLRRQPNPAPAQQHHHNHTTQKEKEATESMGPALDTAESGERLLQNTLGRTDHY